MANLTSTLTVALVDDVSKPARTVAQALQDAETRIKGVAQALAGSGATDNFQRKLAGLKMSAKDIETVAGAWKDYTRAAGLAADSTQWTKAQAAQVKRWEADMVSALRTVKREQEAFAKAQVNAAKIATGPAATAGQPTARNGRMLDPLSAVSGVTAGKNNAEFIFDKAAKQSNELARMSAAGMSKDEIEAATAAATRITSQFPSISGNDALHMLRNARSIVGSYEEAASIIEPLAKLRVLAQAARPGENVAEDFDQLVKGLEIKGVTQNPKQFQEYMQGIAKGINTFGDTLKPYQYYEMFKYGRQATTGLSEKFILGTAPTLAQELGGSSYGKAVSSFNRAVVGGKMDHAAFKTMVSLGLVDDKDIEYTKTTHEAKGFKPGRGAVGSSLAQSDPNEWVKKYLLPALVSHGYTSTDEQQKMIGQLFSNSVGAQMVTLLATQQSRIEKDLALLANAKGLEGVNDIQTGSATIGLQGLSNSIENLAKAAGEPFIQPAITAMTKFSAFLNNMSGWFEKNKPAAAAGAVGAVGVSAIGGVVLARALLGALGLGVGVELKGSAAALTGAAMALDGAAAALKASSIGGATVPGAAAAAAVPAAEAAGAGWLGALALPASVGAVMAYLAAQEGDFEKKHPDLFQKAQAHSTGSGLGWAVQGGATEEEREWLRTHPADIFRAPTKNSPLPQNPAAAPVALNVDTSGIAAVKPVADEAKGAVDALNVTAKPNVDTSSIGAALEMIRQLNAEIAKASGGAAALSGSLSGAEGKAASMLGTLGRIQRGNFSTGGVKGE